MRARTLLIPVVCFACALALFSLLSGDGDPRADGAGARSPDGTGRGLALLQKARETGDTSYYDAAGEAFRRQIRRAPKDADAVAGLALLQVARHDFRDGLVTSRKALALRPTGVIAYPGLVDALVELGRYEEAERTVERMVALRPGLASYSRISYLRELRGDLPGAAAAMRLAISSGSGVPENLASVQALLGNLEFARGRLEAARSAYGDALATVRGHAPATFGLARLDAAAGRTAQAVDRLRALVKRIALPEYVIALGEAELVLGEEAAARRTFAVVEEERKRSIDPGVNTDVELAVFQADHGDRRLGVDLGRRAWEAAPSVRSADARAWTLTRSGRSAEGWRWARRALRYGWQDATVLFHSGMAAKAAGRPGEARRLLRQALRRNPGFSALRAPLARRALRELGAQPS